MPNYTPLVNYDGAEVILRGFGTWLKRAKDDGRPAMPDDTVQLRDMWQAALCEGANTLEEDACFACGQADADLTTWRCSLCCRISTIVAMRSCNNILAAPYLTCHLHVTCHLQFVSKGHLNLVNDLTASCVVQV